MESATRVEKIAPIRSKALKTRPVVVIFATREDPKERSDQPRRDRS